MDSFWKGIQIFSRFNSTLSNNHFSLVGCCFIDLNTKYSGLSGGAIYISASSSSLIVGSSLFYNCSSWNGGGIYFSSSNGNLSLNRIGAAYCYVYDGSGQFMTSSSTNLLLMCSIYKCGTKWFPYNQNTLSFSSYPFMMENINISGVNMYANTGVYSYSSSTSFSRIDIDFCTFYDNKGMKMLSFWKQYEINIHSTWFVNNTNTDYGLISIDYSHFWMWDSVFLGNVGKIFYLNWRSCKVELHNTYFDVNKSIHYGVGDYGFFIYDSPENNTMGINTHYQTHIIYAIFPLTPSATETPEPTPIFTIPPPPTPPRTYPHPPTPPRTYPPPPTPLRTVN